MYKAYNPMTRKKSYTGLCAIYSKYIIHVYIGNRIKSPRQKSPRKKSPRKNPFECR